MMRCCIWLFSLFVFTFVLKLNNSYAQSTELYRSAIRSLEQKDTSSAKEYLSKSIKENSDAASYLLLSDLYVKENSVSKRDAALYMLNNAIIRYPDSLQLKIKYAEIMTMVSPSNAIVRYKNIIRQDSTCYDAWFKLGLLFSEEYTTYNKAFVVSDAGYPLSTKDLTKEDLRETTDCFKHCIELNPRNFEPYLNLSFVYEEADSLSSSIGILQKYIRNSFSKSKEIFLYLGHLCTKASLNSQAFDAFSNAMDLMDNQEKEDFTYNSIKFVLSDAFAKAFSDMQSDDLKKLIDTYWNMQDPLRLTGYNERLLEHYSRVAYANVHFTRKGSYIPGWKTDRGETILRYGEPSKYERLRPTWSGISGDKNPDYILNPQSYYQNPQQRNNSRKGEVIIQTPRLKGIIGIPNDIFYYPDMRIVFSDWSQTGNFVFNTPNFGAGGSVTQVSDNSERLMNTLRNSKPAVYEPKYEGPVFTVPFNILQFRNINTISGSSDVYISYSLKVDEKIQNAVNKYLLGVFFFDNLFRPVIEHRDSVFIRSNDNLISAGKDLKMNVNSVKLIMPPDSGYLCFEMIRESDKGVSSNHGRAKIKKFSKDSLSVSDLVLAGKLTTGGSKDNWLNRKQISLIPNPTHLFSREQDLYVYYELYNLNLDTKGSCSFEQTLTIIDKNYNKKSIITRFFNSIGGLIGLSNEDKRLSLVSNHSLKDRDQQMYMQLDLSQYQPGDYTIGIRVKDVLTGKEASSETELALQ